MALMESWNDNLKNIYFSVFYVTYTFLPVVFLTFIIMGGGGRYPYPKYVWSPAGGWWTRPSNWVANTAIASIGIIAVTYGIWRVSASLEKRTVQPSRPIPSMLWAKEYTDAEKK